MLPLVILENKHYKVLPYKLCHTDLFLSCSQPVQQGATCPYKVVQRDIILYNIQSLVNEMYTAIKNKKEVNAQLLRFMVSILYP